MSDARTRTQESVRDGYGGDTYRRRSVCPGEYQCGCMWTDASNVPEAYSLGVRGDVLMECQVHRAATEAKALTATEPK